MNAPTCYNCKQKVSVILFEQQNRFRARVCRNYSHYATYSRRGHQKAETKTLKCFWAWYHSVEFCVSDPGAFMGYPPRPIDHIDHSIALLETFSSFKSLTHDYSAEGAALRAMGSFYGLAETEVRTFYDAWLDLQVELEFAGDGSTGDFANPPPSG